ncbi:hypothetical protein [Streptomyces sp. NPDC001889]
MTVRPYVEIPRPYETSPNRFDVELFFPASSKRRAEQHHKIAWELARIYDVDAATPFKINPRWSVYEEQWGNGQPHGWRDYRRLDVHGKPRALARYLAALTRVITSIERMATRAARTFGTWRRSLIAQFSGHLEYEDPTTLRIRAKDFRTQALDTLVGYLAPGAPRAPHRDPSRPLWEQAATVANEVWEETGGVDPWSVPEDDVRAHLDRMRHIELSVVAEPAAPSAHAVTVPDTVEELLELSGPADRAPAEPPLAPQPTVLAARTGTPPGGRPDRAEPAGRASAACGAPIRTAPPARTDAVPLPARPPRDLRGRTPSAFPDTDTRWLRPTLDPGVLHESSPSAGLNAGRPRERESGGAHHVHVRRRDLVAA